MKKVIFLLSSAFVLVPKLSLAHCPLCTAGAGALAVLAAYLGISSVVVGIFIGAFSLALGLWLAPLVTKWLGKEYFSYQTSILAFLIFLSTVIPIMPLVRDYGPLYLPFMGEYGTTYTINLYIVGVIIGGLLMFLTPFLSKFISNKRGKTMPYQGITLTLALLIAVSVIVQLLA